MTSPRREIASKRTLLNNQVGDFVVVEEDNEKLAVGRIERIEYGNRGFPELISDDDGSETTAQAIEEIVDDVYVFYDLINEQTGRNDANVLYLILKQETNVMT